ncbi:MAG: hypothetical protein EA351_08230 [Gemmatimonadales bacterium]|nr:MAG: hypothetical protein EA351_08230 [Gemmatimonadales bacterium]
MLWTLAALLVVVGLPACEGSTTVVTNPRFAQIGEIRIDVQRPIEQGPGATEATLVWMSDGRWVLVERMLYQGVLGEERILNSRLNPGQLAPEYATLNQQLNENPGLRLPGEVDQGLIPNCAAPRSRVRVTMVDTFRDEVAQWTRCADGSLFNLSVGSAGPDANAPRVVNAAQLVRAFTVGEDERSVFEGSIPFANLDRGDNSPARPDGPMVFLTEDGTEPQGWSDFWQAHSEGSAAPPVIDWSSQMVLVGTPGLRNEAGHTVNIRRVLPVGTATRVEMLEEIPGDFCSPAARERYPFHIVVAPLAPRPVSFSEPRELRVPCGS